MGPQSLAQTYPGGCFLGFNAAIDRKASEQLVLLCGQAATNGFSEISLLLTSSGGVIDHAHYICGILRALPVRIVTYNVGNISSCANLLFLCGEQRYSAPVGTFYFHRTYYPPPADQQVTASFVKTRAEAISRDDARSAQWVSERTGQSVKDVLRWMRNELTLDASGAFAAGIIQEIKAPVIPAGSLFQQVVV